MDCLREFAETKGHLPVAEGGAAACTWFVGEFLAKPKTVSSAAHDSRRQLTARVPHLITAEQIEQHPRPEGVKAIKETLKIHSVKFDSRGRMSSRRLSCCCEPCMRGDEDSCLNSAWVQLWKREELRHSTAAASDSEEELEEEAWEDSMEARVRALPEESWVAVPISCAPARPPDPAARRASSRLSNTEADGLYALVQLKGRAVPVTEALLKKIPTAAVGDTVFRGSVTRVTEASAARAFAHQPGWVWQSKGAG